MQTFDELMEEEGGKPLEGKEYLLPSGWTGVAVSTGCKKCDSDDDEMEYGGEKVEGWKIEEDRKHVDREGWMAEVQSQKWKEAEREIRGRGQNYREVESEYGTYQNYEDGTKNEKEEGDERSWVFKMGATPEESEKDWEDSVKEYMRVIEGKGRDFQWDKNVEKRWSEEKRNTIITENGGAEGFNVSGINGGRDGEVLPTSVVGSGMKRKHSHDEECGEEDPALSELDWKRFGTNGRAGKKAKLDSKRSGSVGVRMTLGNRKTAKDNGENYGEEPDTLFGDFEQDESVRNEEEEWVRDGDIKTPLFGWKKDWKKLVGAVWNARVSATAETKKNLLADIDYRPRLETGKTELEYDGENVGALDADWDF